MDNREITIIGAGLAGCEAALQLADHGKKVVIYDQKPEQLCSPYCMKSIAELVCNNALGPRSTNDPRGLLISELDILGSKLLRIAKRTSLSDNTYLSVNKKDFSESVSAALLHSNNKPVFAHFPKQPITSPKCQSQSFHNAQLTRC